MRILVRVSSAVLLVLLLVSALGLEPVPAVASASAAGLPKVTFTLLLANNTLLPGNARVGGGATTPNPQGMVLDPSTGDVYVAVPRSDSIIVVNTHTNRVADNITVGYQPTRLALDPSSGFLYVVNGLDDHVSVIDVATDLLVANITTGTNPTAVATGPILGSVFVTRSAPFTLKSEILAVDGTTNAVLSSASLPPGADGVAFDPNNEDVYVASSASNLVSVINGRNLTAPPEEIPRLTGPASMAFDPSNGCIYVAESNGTVAVIDGVSNTVVASVHSFKYPSGLSYDPANGYVYVANSGSNSVSAIDGRSNQIVQNITVGKSPTSVVADSNNGHLYVANGGSGTLSVISFTQAPSPTVLYVVAVGALVAAGLLVVRGRIGRARRATLGTRQAGQGARGHVPLVSTIGKHPIYPTPPQMAGWTSTTPRCRPSSSATSR